MPKVLTAYCFVQATDEDNHMEWEVAKRSVYKVASEVCW